MSDAAIDAPKVAPPRPARPAPQSVGKPKLLPPWGVVLHNDNVNSFEYVVRVLRRVFGYGIIRSFRLTLEAHRAGRSLVWTGHRELAELKAEQIVSCGPDPNAVAKRARPLLATIEQLPEA